MTLLQGLEIAASETKERWNDLESECILIHNITLIYEFLFQNYLK